MQVSGTTEIEKALKKMVATIYVGEQNLARSAGEVIYTIISYIYISPKMTIFKHVGNGQNVSLELVSVYQTIMGDPNNGLDELEQNRSYLNHFPT